MELEFSQVNSQPGRRAGAQVSWEQPSFRNMLATACPALARYLEGQLGRPPTSGAFRLRHKIM